LRGGSASGIAATLVALAALAVPGVARAQTPPPAGGTIDNGTLKVDLDGVGGLQVSYLGSGQLYGGTGSDDGLALRAGDSVSYPGERDVSKATTTLDGTTTAVSDFVVDDPALHVHEIDTLSGPRELTRTFDITNEADTSVDLQAGELADALIGGSDAGRGVVPPFASRMVAGLGPDGQLSGLVESANYPWAHWQEGFYGDIFDDFASSGLHDTVDPNFVDNGFGVEWAKTLAPQGTWELQVIWRFDTSVRVNSTGDDEDGKCDPLTDTTDCTLRDALASSDDGSVITLPAGTYQLDPQHGELAIAKSLSIYGAGMTFEGPTTIDGAGGTRLFDVTDGGDLLLSGVRLQDGNGTSGPIRAPRRALADPPEGDGGAALVQDGGTLTLEDSEVTGNTAAGHGGGIASSGTLTLRRSTVADNVAGAPDSAGQGGGLYLPNPAETSLLDSTVGDNTVYGAGAGIVTGGPLTLLSSTIAGNRVAGDAGSGARGILAIDAAVSVENTILAGAAPVCAGGTFSGASDIVSDTSCNLPDAHQGVDPGLSRLTYFPAGFDELPQTRAFAPQGNSPAVDAGDNGPCSDGLEGIDQLGQPRIQHEACDIGSVEVALAAPVIAAPADGSSVGSTITFSGTAPPNVEVFVASDADADFEPARSGPDGTWTLQYGPVDPGAYTFTAFAMADDGTTSFPSDPVQLSVNGPPAPQISATPVSGSTVTLSGTAAPGDAISILDGGSQVGTTTADGNGNWTVTLANVAPGTHSYTAVAKDAAGNSSAPSPARTVTVAGTQPSPGPTPTPSPAPTPSPTPAPLPPPVKGKEVNAQTKSGTIKVKLPGTNKFVELGPGQQIPTGTVVDTTKGRITLTTAVGGGRTQHADFYQGVFRVTQTRGRKPVTQLALAGSRPTCTTKRKHKKAHAAIASKKKKHKKRVKTRKLWGSGHGAFRTKGQYSSATVRGTTWLTQDSCAGTLTRVTHGVVRVRDFRRHKNVLVRAGHRYLARAKRR
jgi:predicted outer membrane repeat protein